MAALASDESSASDSDLPPRAREAWTPQLVDLWLRRYRDVLETAAEGTVHAVSFTDELHGGEIDPFRLIDIKADLDRALTRLAQLDENPRAAMWIRECYLEGRPITEIAQMDGYTPEWVGKIMARGRERIATILGWTNRQPVLEDK